MQSELKFPEFLSDKKAKKLIEQLLSHNPQQRHGGSFTSLKAHPWFEDFNWPELVNQNNIRLEPPYIPDKASQRQNKQLASRATNEMLDAIKEFEDEEDHISM